MPSRRSFITGTTAVGATLLSPLYGFAENGTALAAPPSATAITQVFGDGQKLVAVALAYTGAIDGARLSRTAFRVEGRTVVEVYASASPSPGEPAPSGPYVILALSPDDPAASLRKAEPGRRRPDDDPAPDGAGTGPKGGGAPDAMRGPPRFEPRQIFRPAAATVIQVEPVVGIDGRSYQPDTAAIRTERVHDPVVDAFRQMDYRDPASGRVLPYNLFIPRDYDAGKTYPLVLFIHDAGTLSHDTTTTLKQGLGAVVWTGPADQAKRPAFVLAPQYAGATVDDRSTASGDLAVTLGLVEALLSRYSIDRTRLYATGQSMGAMMSIAMGIARPDLFAASYIVAGQWDAAKVAPLAKQALWIMVSQGDLKAYPGQNAITAALEKDGATVSRAVWDGRSTPQQFAAETARMRAAGAAINYVALERGTVVPPGQRDDGGSNHINTWRIAYEVEGIREWLFDQRRPPDAP